MKILFLFPYPSGTAASQRFRFEQYLDDLQAQGIRVDRQAFLDEKTWKILYQPGHYFQKLAGIVSGFLRRYLLLFRVSKYHYIFIHREGTPLGPPLLEWMLARVLRKKIIFDFDDAIWLPNTTASNALAARLKFHQKTTQIIKWSYRVSAGNTYLANYARKSNPAVVINPTTIDTEHWHNRVKIHREEAKLVIGWTGTHSTLPYLDMLVPVLARLEKEYAFDLLVIANQPPHFSLDSLVFQAWRKQEEIDDLLRMHIGLMPLQDDPWAQGKCGFKALQYMALGIPALASPVGVNTEIINSGEDGYLCLREEDWERSLRQLLSRS
ncbi:MAG: glycosyltransferase family 4 protein, partial [Bacteroidota bacterium]